MGASRDNALDALKALADAEFLLGDAADAFSLLIERDASAAAAAVVVFVQDGDGSVASDLYWFVSSLDNPGPLAGALLDQDARIASLVISFEVLPHLEPAQRAAWVIACFDFPDDTRWSDSPMWELTRAHNPQHWPVVAELIQQVGLEHAALRDWRSRLESYDWWRQSLFEIVDDDPRRERGRQEAQALQATEAAWRAAGRDPMPWLRAVGTVLDGCRSPGCCGPSAFEIELERLGYRLRRLA